MTEIVDKVPAIIEQAAKSALGIAALIILAVSFIAYMFFRKAGEKARIIIFLAILVGLLGLGLAILIIPPPPPPPPSPPPNLSSNAAPPAPDISSPQSKPQTPQVKKTIEICPSLEIKFIPRFPYYLINTFKNNAKNPYIYWTVLAGENDCKTPQTVEVRFAVRNKTVAQATDIPWTKTFKIGEKIPREPIDPQFEFLHRGENTSLEVTWEIKDKNTNKTFASGTESIPVISDDYIDWNFKDHERKKVPAVFLLASLTAWSLTPGEVIRTRAEQYFPGARSQTTLLESLRQWFRLCYENLFQGPEAVKVSPYAEAWPPLGLGENGLERIRNPREVLQGKVANSVEAVLLVAALRNASFKGTKSRLCLFALPQPDFYTGLKQFVLAWSIDSQEWNAIDLTDPNKLNFAENHSANSTKITNLMKSRGDILVALNEQGVFIDDRYSIYIIDFDEAKKKYDIGGLPQK